MEKVLQAQTKSCLLNLEIRMRTHALIYLSLLLKAFCQNPELQSSFVKTLEPDSYAKIWSTLESG